MFLKHLLSIFSFVLFFELIAQPANNCPSTAEFIDQCGVSFTTTNAGANNICACEGVIGEDWWPWDGIIDNMYYATSFHDLDCNLGTGFWSFLDFDINNDYYIFGDVGYSVENDIWYEFCPTATGTWTIDITPYSCNSLNGYQVALFQGTSDNLHTLLVGGQRGDDFTGPVQITIDINVLGECLFLQLDGFAGTECVFDVVVTEPAGLAGCELVLPIQLRDMEVYAYAGRNLVTWDILSEREVQYYNLYRSADGEHFEYLTNITAYQDGNEIKQYYYADYISEEITYYYKLSAINVNGEELFLDQDLAVRSREDKILLGVFNLVGQEVQEDYQGPKIYKYSDGSYEKVAY